MRWQKSHILFIAVACSMKVAWVQINCNVIEHVSSFLCTFNDALFCYCRRYKNKKIMMMTTTMMLLYFSILSLIIIIIALCKCHGYAHSEESERERLILRAEIEENYEQKCKWKEYDNFITLYFLSRHHHHSKEPNEMELKWKNDDDEIVFWNWN